ncbi:MAG TPA: hypothetical protein PK677_02980 [Acidiphilium sp.]|nr:hypothetical protein [Acidiphilium sp.]HQU23500.1 hypothetical protein [Acidiphilium sp.]
MRGFIKTLIGDARNLACIAIIIGVAAALIASPARPLAGLLIPLALLAAAAYLARK